MNVDDYRSPLLARGYFRRLDCLHLHVDGGGRFDRVLPFLREAREANLSSKLTKVSRAVAGPQRDELRDTYESHTPGSPSSNDFDYFATIALTDRQHAISTVKTILPALIGAPNFVLEVERVIAATEGDSPWSQSSKLEDLITIKDVGYSPSPTLPLEIHHGFDTSVDCANVVNLDQLLAEITNAGISVGGWFVFDRTNEICFRSNAFTAYSNYLAKAAKQHEVIGEYLRRKGITHTLWTTVEQILGIWNSKLLKSDGIIMPRSDG